MVTAVKYEDGTQQGEVEVQVADDGYLLLNLTHTDDGDVSLALNKAEAINLMANLAAAINEMA